MTYCQTHLRALGLPRYTGCSKTVGTVTGVNCSFPTTKDEPLRHGSVPSLVGVNVSACVRMPLRSACGRLPEAALNGQYLPSNSSITRQLESTSHSGRTDVIAIGRPLAVHDAGLTGEFYY